MRKHIFRTWAPCALLCVCCGCSLFYNKARVAEQQELIEQKKENYQALSDYITSGRVAKGTSSKDILKMFGRPDDVFHSGSTISQFEIWTYEKISDPKSPEIWEHIRLYFDNGRLISWKY